MPRDVEFRPPSSGDQARGIMRLSEDLRSTRANIWRMPAGSRGRRHVEKVQEELFVVLDGMPTLRLGEPAESIVLPAGSVAVVEPGTAQQLLNDGNEDAVVLIVGAPPVEGQAEYLPE